jgi:hypothetical protein
MRHIRVLICRVDDPASDQMTERAAFDLPATDVSTLQPETALDALETTTRETGNAILRRTFQAQSDLIDDEVPYPQAGGRALSRTAHSTDRDKARRSLPEAMSDALAALRTLILNGGWERY